MRPSHTIHKLQKFWKSMMPARARNITCSCRHRARKDKQNNAGSRHLSPKWPCPLRDLHQKPTYKACAATLVAVKSNSMQQSSQQLLLLLHIRCKCRRPKLSGGSVYMISGRFRNHELVSRLQNTSQRPIQRLQQ